MPLTKYHIGFDYPQNVSNPLGTPLSPTFQKIRVAIFGDEENSQQEGRGLRSFGLYRNPTNSSALDYNLISGELEKFFLQANSRDPLLARIEHDTEGNPPLNELHYYLFQQDDQTQVSAFMPTPVIGGRFLIVLLHKVLVVQGMIPAPFFGAKDEAAYQERKQHDLNFGGKSYEEQLNFQPLEEMYLRVIKLLQRLIDIPQILPRPTNKDLKTSYGQHYDQLTGYRPYAELTKEGLYLDVLAPLLNKLLELMSSSDKTPELAAWIARPTAALQISGSYRKQEALNKLPGAITNLANKVEVWRQEGEVIEISPALQWLTRFYQAIKPKQPQQPQRQDLDETIGSRPVTPLNKSGSSSSVSSFAGATVTAMVNASDMLAQFTLCYQDQALGMQNRQGGALASTWTLPRKIESFFLKVTIAEADYAKWPYLFPELSWVDNPAVNVAKQGLMSEITFVRVNNENELLPLWILLFRLTRALCGQYKAAGFADVNKELDNRLALQNLCEYFCYLLRYTTFKTAAFTVMRDKAQSIATFVTLILNLLTAYGATLPAEGAVQSTFQSNLKAFRNEISDNNPFVNAYQNTQIAQDVERRLQQEEQEKQGSSPNVFEDTLLMLKHYRAKYLQAAPNSDQQRAYAVNCWMLRWFLAYLIEQPEQPFAERLKTWSKSIIISIGKDKYYTGNSSPQSFEEIISDLGKLSHGGVGNALKAWYERVSQYVVNQQLQTITFQLQQPDWRLKYQPNVVIDLTETMQGASILSSPPSAPLGVVVQMVQMSSLPADSNYQFLQLEGYYCKSCNCIGFETMQGSKQPSEKPKWCMCERGFQAFLKYSITKIDPRRPATPPQQVRSGSGLSTYSFHSNSLYLSSDGAGNAGSTAVMGGRLPVATRVPSPTRAAAGTDPQYDLPPSPEAIAFSTICHLIDLLTDYRNNWQLLEPQQATYLADLLAACLMKQGQPFASACQELAQQDLGKTIVSRLKSSRALPSGLSALLQARYPDNAIIPGTTVDQLYQNSSKQDATSEDRKRWRTVSLLAMPTLFDSKAFTFKLKNALGDYINAKNSALVTSQQQPIRLSTIALDDDPAVFPSLQQVPVAQSPEPYNYGPLTAAPPPGGISSSFADPLGVVVGLLSSAPPSPTQFGPGVGAAAASTPQRHALSTPPATVDSAHHLQLSPLSPYAPSAHVYERGSPVRFNTGTPPLPGSGSPRYLEMTGVAGRSSSAAAGGGSSSPIYSVANETNPVWPIVRLIELLSGKYGFFVNNIEGLPAISQSLIQQLLIVSLISPNRTWGEIFTDVTQNRLYVFENFTLDPRGLENIFRAIVNAATPNEKFSAPSSTPKGATSFSAVQMGIVEPQAIVDLKAMFGLDQTQQFAHTFGFIMPDNNTIKTQLEANRLWGGLMGLLGPLVAGLPKPQQGALTRYYAIIAQ